MGRTLWDYILSKAADITDSALKDVTSLQSWEGQRAGLYQEFMRSAGLDGKPRKIDLETKSYGEFTGKGYRAVRVAYEILPDCWGTGSIYYPEPTPSGKLPAVLYVSGHRPIGTYGYQQHPIMWARRGYVSLVFDTIEQHDNPGSHLGTYTGRRMDWISRGYSAAGGELLNSIRALDLLSSLPEVDPDRIGATGISGGGAHSFYLAVADHRVRAVASVAGVTCLRHTLANRNFLHHCDCMYMTNLNGRDNADFAALIAPRPLLLCYARDDSLFNREGYTSLFKRVREVYRMYDAEERLRLFEYPGPHSYTPEAVEEINRWFDRYVAGEDHPPVPLGPEGENQEQDVTIFNGMPPQTDRLDILPALLTKRGGVRLPRERAEWPSIREEAVKRLRREALAWVDRNDEELIVEQAGDWLAGETKCLKYSGSIGGMNVWIEVWSPPNPNKCAIVALADRENDIPNLLGQLRERFPRNPLALIEPRGTGLEAYGRREYRFLLRASALTGFTPVLMWIQDLGKILPFLRGLPVLRDREFLLFGNGDAAAACLYHSILDDSISAVILRNLPRSHLDGAYILGILRVMDIQEAIGLMAPRPVGLVGWPAPRSQFPERVYRRLGVPERYILGGSLKSVGERLMDILEAG